MSVFLEAEMSECVSIYYLVKVSDSSANVGGDVREKTDVFSK